MPAIKLEQFGGMLPAWDDRILPPGQAANSQNAYLFGGTLQGWRQPKLLRTLTNSAAKFVYRIPTITKTVAQAYLIFSSNPANNDTVQIDEVVYTFKTTIANAFDVLIGASAAASATNLLAAVTVDNGVHTNEGTLYGTGTEGNPSTNNAASGGSTTGTSGLGSYLQCVAADAGVQFNTVIVAATGTHLAWSSSSSVSTPTSTLTGGTNPSYDTSITGASQWLEYVDPETTVMRSPVVDDTYLRHYSAAPNDRPKYNTYDRIVAGSPWWYLGVPGPGCTPGVVPTGGGNTSKEGYPNPSLTGAGAVSVSANYIYLVPFTPMGAEQINDVSFMPAADALTAKVKAVIYTDISGAPGNLLNVGIEVQGVQNGTQQTSVFNYPSGLLQGDQYWIGIISDTALSLAASDDTGTHGYYKSGTYATPPTSGSGGTASAATPNMWGDMTTSAQLEARAYVYTYVTAYDEESPPSPPGLETGWDNATWTISLFEPPSEEMGTIRDITSINVYRTIPSQTGQTQYFFVTSVPVGTATVTDTATSDVIALNATLESNNWFPPPLDLQCIMSMPNGVCVGFRSNEIWFSEAYRPHAWPPGYVLTTEFPIVGLGVTGQSVVACTTGLPYVASGVSPGTMTLVKVPLAEPCIARGSIVGRDDGVYYCSQNGLIRVDQSGAGVNVTEAWITREKWRALTPAKNHRAAQLIGLYCCFGTTEDGTTTYAQQGFNLEMNDDSQSFGIWPQPGHHRMGLQLMGAPNGYNIDSFLVDVWTGTGIFIQNGGVYYYDFSDASPTITPYVWRSKKYQQTDRKNMEALRIYFDIPPGTPAQGTRNTAAFSDASWATLGGTQYGIVRIYADDVLVMAREIWKTGELLRIPSGFKVETWQFEFVSRVSISNVQIATTVKELADI